MRRRVQELFGRVPHSELNPDEVVALGAAVQADILAGGTTHMLLLDVTPLSLGIETLGGAVSVLIPRNTTIPTSANEGFTTSVDGQSVVDMHVVQGERDLAKDNRSLARFDLRGIPPMPAGLPRIEVTFLIDANGILSVTAKETRSGTQASVEVRPTYGLSEAEVDRMIDESLEHAEADVRARGLIDARNEADTVLRATEKALVQGAEFLGTEEAARIREAVAALAHARHGEDAGAIRGGDGSRQPRDPAAGRAADGLGAAGDAPGAAGGRRAGGGGALTMARYRVTFKPANVTVEVDDKDFPYGDHGKPGSLLDIALHHGIRMDHNCGGNCACTTCHVVVREGEENLSPMESDEEDRLDTATGLTLHSRLGCQAIVQGDVVVDIVE